MKKIVLSALITINLLNASGIPVVDVLANTQIAEQNAQTIATWAKEAERWVGTVDHYKNQLKAYNDQLVSQTGVRDSVSFIQDIDEFNKFSNTYSKEFLSIENKPNSDTPIGIKSKELFEKYNLYNDCEVEHLTSKEQEVCKGKMERKVRDIAAYQTYTNNLDGIHNNLEGLTRKLATSKDIKESQDINNAIQLQLAQLELTKTQIELMNEQSRTLDDVERRQKEQLLKLNKGKSADFRKLQN